jgi:phage shock protein PspC (stress-responsive transcriptional regulator)
MAAMEHSKVHLIKRYDFRPLLLRIVWCINIFLISFLFWVFVYCCLRNFN